MKSIFSIIIAMSVVAQAITTTSLPVPSLQTSRSLKFLTDVVTEDEKALKEANTLNSDKGNAGGVEDATKALAVAQANLAAGSGSASTSGSSAASVSAQVSAMLAQVDLIKAGLAAASAGSIAPSTVSTSVASTPPPAAPPVTPPPAAAPPVVTPPPAAASGICLSTGVAFDAGKANGGVGFDNRQEASFRPIDLSHGSAQRIGIIVQDICNKETDNCDRKQDKTCACRKKCDAAVAASASATPGKAQADAFNKGMGL